MINIYMLATQRDVFVDTEYMLSNGFHMGKINKGEKWSFRTDWYSQDDGIIYIMAVSLYHQCASKIHSFIPIAESGII